MKDHEIAKLVNDLTAVAKKYHDMQQLREQIAKLIRPIEDDPMNGQWHKIAALLMLKHGEGSVHFKVTDILALPVEGRVTVAEMPDGLLVRLLLPEEDE